MQATPYYCTLLLSRNIDQDWTHTAIQQQHEYLLPLWGTIEMKLSSFAAVKHSTTFVVNEASV